ncbi:MAG: type IV secretory system conjugative DNA transfer family protein [Clostridia bacterium]|nr:type IV secretory system conjugative DNA transfer family protein [Clostridia bacterium]
MKNFLKLFFIALLFVGFYVLAICANSWLSGEGFKINQDFVTDSMTYLIFGILCAIVIIKFLFDLADGKRKKKDKGGGISDSGKDEKGNKVKQYFSNDFISEKDLETKSEYNFTTFKNLRNVKKDGILIRADRKDKDMAINFIKPIHTLIIGTTSSGKTSTFIEPTMQLLSMTAAKPSFVVTDPKGELFEFNSEKLKKEGYEVVVLDLKNPFQSVQWNPLSHVYDVYHRAYSLEREVKVHPAGDNPNSYGLMLEQDFDYNNNHWYEFNKIAYVSKLSCERDMKVLHGKLKDDALSELKDIAQSIAPVKNTKDSSWETTAQNLIQAVCLAMLEDSFDSSLGLTKDKYNFYNVSKIANYTDSGSDNYKSLKTYLFNYRDKFSKVAGLANTALNNADSTTKNYMGFVSSGLAMFTDSGICYMTSGDTIDLMKIDEKPTAIFIRIPDEIEVRHPLGTLFISQLYKRLVEKADSLGGQLKRHVYFLLDEFGNMPKFTNFGATLAVARGRGIYYEIVLQSYSQLSSKYGDQEGKIIRDNCPIQVYVGSDEYGTNKEFSELLGNKTIEMTSVNTSTGADGKENKTESKQIHSIPIAAPHELPTFRNDKCLVIKSFSPSAVYKNRFIPSDFPEMAPFYDRTRASARYIPMHEFDEENVFYDFLKRNDKMKKSSSDDDDDDLFDF